MDHILDIAWFLSRGVLTRTQALKTHFTPRAWNYHTIHNNISMELVFKSLSGKGLSNPSCRNAPGVNELPCVIGEDMCWYALLCVTLYVSIRYSTYLTCMSSMADVGNVCKCDKTGAREDRHNPTLRPQLTWNPRPLTRMTTCTLNAMH